MNVVLSIVVALLNAVLACVAAGAVAHLCVDWFRIHAREGQAGYFVLMIAFLGAIAGVIIGLLTARVVGTADAATFFKALGLSCGIAIALAGVGVSTCWLLADIPPRIDGESLDLVIELRLPAGEAQPAAQSEGDSYVVLGSVNPLTHVQRTSEQGTLRPAEARLDNGRCIVPGSVSIFTTRGDRTIGLTLNGKERGGFVVPLPARPKHEHEQWSEWLPRGRPGGLPWPDTECSYRYCVRRHVPPPPPPDPAVVRAAEFAALAPDVPIDQWLRFLGMDAPPERTRAVLAHVEQRATELAAAIRADDGAAAERALEVVAQIATIAPEVADAVRDVGRTITQGIGRFNAMQPEDAQYYDVASDLRNRFSVWHRSWWSVHHKTGCDGRPLLREIMALARVHAGGTCMDEIVLNARVHLEALEPKAPDQQ